MATRIVRIAQQRSGSNGTARGHGLLGDFDGGLGVQHVEIGAIHIQQNRIPSGLRVLRGGLGLKTRTGNQVVSGRSR